MNNMVFIILAVYGVISIVAAVLNPDFFFESGKIARVARIFGRTVARIIMGATGVFAIGLAAFKFFTQG